MKRINIIFDDREASLILALQKEYGGTIPQVIRSAVKFHFDKTFPAHTRVARGGKVSNLLPKEEILTPGQACESVGGRVDTVNGIPMCVIPISRSMNAQVPLSAPELILKYKKP